MCLQILCCHAKCKKLKKYVGKDLGDIHEEEIEEDWVSGFIKNLTISNYENQYGSNDKNIGEKYICLYKNIL